MYQECNYFGFEVLHSVDVYSIRNPVLVMELSVSNEIVTAPPLVMYKDGFVSPQNGTSSAPSTIVNLSLLKSKYFMLGHSTPAVTNSISELKS